MGRVEQSRPSWMTLIRRTLMSVKTSSGLTWRRVFPQDRLKPTERNTALMSFPLKKERQSGNLYSSSSMIFELKFCCSLPSFLLSWPSLKTMTPSQPLLNLLSSCSFLFSTLLLVSGRREMQSLLLRLSRNTSLRLARSSVLTRMVSRRLSLLRLSLAPGLSTRTRRTLSSQEPMLLPVKPEVSSLALELPQLLVKLEMKWQTLKRSKLPSNRSLTTLLSSSPRSSPSSALLSGPSTLDISTTPPTEVPGSREQSTTSRSLLPLLLLPSPRVSPLSSPPALLLEPGEWLPRTPLSGHSHLLRLLVVPLLSALTRLEPSPPT